MAAPTALADTIVENIAFNGSVENQPVFVTGPLFDPALGTLTGVSATVQGQFDADIFVPALPGPGRTITLALGYQFISDGAIDRGQLGDFSVQTHNGSDYTGQTNFDFSETIASIDAYVDGAPDETNYLAALAFGATPSPPIGFGASSDFSTWSADMQLTYTYAPAIPVPEPACTALFALSCLTLATARWRLRKR
jgi:hypothetical protein